MVTVPPPASPLRRSEITVVGRPHPPRTTTVHSPRSGARGTVEVAEMSPPRNGGPSPLSGSRDRPGKSTVQSPPYPTGQRWTGPAFSPIV